MSESRTIGSTMCRQCGQVAFGASGSCAYCGAPLGTPAAPGVRQYSGSSVHRDSAPTAEVPAYRFEPAPLSSGVRLGRRGWLTIGICGAVAVVALVAFLVLRPDPPSPRRTVEAYFAALGSGETAKALALVDTGGGFTPDAAPMLVPAALADAANRPTAVTVTGSRTDATGRLTLVTVIYKIGGQPIGQTLAVETTGDEQRPYLLTQPFIDLSVQPPYGLAATVNGIAVPTDSFGTHTAAFPGAYQATTTGNALFAGSTQAATYQSSDTAVLASIEFGPPALAPNASSAVQEQVQQLLDGNCVHPAPDAYGYGCPVQAPYRSWNQTTTWKITAYPQIGLRSPDAGQTAVAFSTESPGTATYKITYADFGGKAQTESGTVPITITGYAELRDGAIHVVLGY